MLKALMYARKSSEGDDKQALSIESQIAELTVLSQAKSIEVSSIFREAHSAKFPGRPEFTRMLNYLKQNPGSTILCWKLDRLARNLQDAALLTQLMQDGVITEILTPSSRYGNSSMDLFISGLDFLMAKKYIDDLSENVKRGLRTKVHMGWKPGVAPFGYKTTGEYRKGYRTLEPDPEIFDRVRMLWDQVLEHRVSVKELVKFGRSIGLTVSNSKLYSMLTNPFYYGHFLWNGELYPGKHMPMVSIHKFKQVQQHLGRVPKKPRETLSFTFRGLLTCGECGGAITAEKKRKYVKRTKETREYIYYHCSHNKSNIECRQLSVSEEELMRQITAKLESISVPIAEAGKFEQELYKKEFKKALRSIPSATEQKTSIDRIDQKISNLLSLMLSHSNVDRSLLSDEEYKREKNRLLQERQLIIENTQRLSLVREKVKAIVTRKVMLATTGLKRFLDGNSRQKREILNALGSNHILVDKTLVFIGQSRRDKMAYPALTRLRYDVRTKQKHPTKMGLWKRSLISRAGMAV